MSEIATIGNLKEVFIFNAFNIDVYPVDEMKKDKSLPDFFKEILVNKNYKLVFVSEVYYTDFESVYNSLKLTLKEKLPVIISIPNGIEYQGLGIKKLKSIVEKAIGIDVFKNI